MTIKKFGVIRYPLITEKNSALRADDKYVFEVDSGATKTQIGKAVQELFGVKVLSVNTAVVKGKRRRRGRSVGYSSDRKKAFVRLAKGQKIEKFGEV